MNKRDPRIVIIGAGVAGIASAYTFQQSGFTNFTILEKGSDVGGVWHWNRYPGLTCDVPSHIYQFAFAPKPDWSHIWAGGQEIQEYHRDVVDELDLPNVEVVRARADELWGQRTFDVVTSRAVARIGELARWSLPLVSRGGEMFVLKGSSAAEERDEDEAVLRRLRVRTAEVETWGEGTVEPPTVTVRLTVDGVAPQLTRKKAGTIDKTKQKPSRRPDRRA